MERKFYEWKVYLKNELMSKCSLNRMKIESTHSAEVLIRDKECALVLKSVIVRLN